MKKIIIVLAFILSISSSIGQNITEFSLANNNFASSNISNLVIDPLTNYAWVATTDTGIGIYDGSTWSYMTASNSDMLSSNVSKIYISGNTKWIAYNNGLSKLVGNTWTHYTSSSYPLLTNIQNLSMDNSGTLWIINGDYKVLRINGSNLDSVFFSDTLFPTETFSTAGEVYMTDFCNSTNRLFKFNGTTFVPIILNATPSTYCYSRVFKAKDTAIIAVRDSILEIYGSQIIRKAQICIITKDTSNTYNSINSIIKTKEQKYYIARNRSIIDNNTCGSINDFNQDFYAMALDTSGTIWAGGIFSSTFYRITPQANLTRGNVYRTSDCLFPMINQVPGIKLTIEPVGNVIYTDSFGQWQVPNLPIGSYTINIDTGNLWSYAECRNNQFNFEINAANQMTLAPDILLTAKSECAAPIVSLSIPKLKKCQNHIIKLIVQNQTYATKDLEIGEKITLQLAPELSVQSYPIGLQNIGNNRYEYTLQSPISSGRQFVLDINVSVACSDSVWFKSLCLSAELAATGKCYALTNANFENNTCSTAYDLSDLWIQAECIADTAKLTIHNSGSGNTLCPVPLALYANGVKVLDDSTILLPNQSYTLSYPSNGQTISATAANHPKHPSKNVVVSHIEKCGDLSNFIPRVPLQFTRYRYSPLYYYNCVIVDSTILNYQKSVAPEGLGSNNQISNKVSEPLNYNISFQNTSSQLISSVTIIDTLNTNLDLSTLIISSTSHTPYTSSIANGVLTVKFDNIRLTPSSSNVDSSIGYFNYCVAKKPGLSDGTTITNRANIQFENLPANSTNVVFNTIVSDPQIIPTAHRDTMSVISCKAYNLNGQIYHRSQNFIDTIPGQLNSIDTIRYYQITIAKPTREIIMSSCDSIKFLSKTYRMTGVYTDSTSAYCDTIYTLRLTINKSIRITIDTLVQKQYTYRGVTYTESKSFRDSGQTMNGCDSIYQINFKVQQKINRSVQLKSCMSATFNGKTYTSNGSYYDSIQVAGVDTIYFIDVSLGQPTINTIVAKSCNQYRLSNKIYTASGKYIDTLVSSYGCDSIRVLILTIDSINSNVTRSGITYTIGEPDTVGVSYQWYTCNPFKPISGQTKRSISTASKIRLQAIVKNAKCIDTSDCISFNSSSISKIATEHLWLYPNPTSGILNIDFDNWISEVRIDVIDMSGRVILRNYFSNTTKATIDLSLLASSTYMIHIVTDQWTQNLKIYKN